MAALGSLVVKLALEYAQYTQGLNKADQEALKFAESAQKHFDRAKSAGSEFFVGMAKGAVGAVTAFLTAEQALAQFNRAVEELAGLDDLSQKIGASVENLSKMQKVARAFGTDMGSVDGALTKLAKGMATVDSETNKTNKALEALGIKSKDAAGKLRDPSEVMIDVSRALQNYEDGANKAALVTDLFGKSGADLLPYLNDMAESIDKFGSSSTEAAAQASRYQDALGMLRVRSDEFFTSLSLSLLPTITDFVEALNDTKKSSDTLSGNDQLSSWVDDLAVGLARVLDVAKVVPQAIRAIGGSFEAVGADIELLNYLKENANPIAAGKKLLEGRSPTDEMKAALDKRNKIVEDANKRYVDLWNQPANSLEQAMLDRISKRAYSGVDPFLYGGGDAGGGKSPLGYTTGNASGGKDAKEQVSDYEKLTRAIQEKISAQQAEMSVGRELTEAEKIRAKLNADYLTNAIKITPEEKAKLEAMIDQAGALDSLNERRKTSQKLAADALAEDQKSVETAKQMLEKLETEIQYYDALPSVLTGVTISKQEARLEALRLVIGTESETQAVRDQIAALEDLIATNKRVRSAQSRKEDLDAEKKKNEEIRREWQRTTDRIETALTDALMRGFENGKSFAENFKETIANMFKTMILRPVIQGVVQNTIGGAMNTVSGFAGGSAGGGGSGAMGMLSNGMSLYNAGNAIVSGSLLSSGTVGGYLTGASTVAPTSVFAANGVGAVGGDALGTLIAAEGWGGSTALGAGAAFTEGAAAAGTASGSAAAGLSSMLASIPVWGWILLAIVAFKDKLFGHKTVGSGIEGVVNGADVAAQGYQFQKGGWFRSDRTKYSELDPEVNNFMDSATEGLADTFNTIGESIGAGAKMMDGFHYEFRLALADFDEAGKQAEIQRFMASMTDSMALSFVDNFRTSVNSAEVARNSYFTNTIDGQREFGEGETVAKSRVASQLDPYVDDMLRIFDKFRAGIAGKEGTEGQVAAFVTRLFQLGDALADNAGFATRFGEALTFSKLESVAKKGEDVFAAFDRINTVFAATNAISELMGNDVEDAFGAVGLASTEARERLISLAGGLDSLASKVNGFAANFLTEAERLAPVSNAVASVYAKYGMSGSTTREQFTQAVKDASRDSSAAGQQKYIDLLSIQGQADALFDFWEKGTKEVSDAAKVASDNAKKLADDAIAKARATSSKEAEFMRLAGNAAGALAIERKLEIDAMDESLRPIQERINKLTDAKTKEEKAIADLESKKSDLLSAYDRESAALQETVDKFDNFAKSLRAFQQQLLTGDLSTLSPEEKYRAAKANFEAVAAAAAGGDEKAMGELQGASQEFLEISRQYYASSEQYAADFALVQAAIGNAADSAASQAQTARDQLTELKSTVAALGILNTSVLSVKDALTAYASALDAKVAASAAVVSAGGTATWNDTSANGVIEGLYSSLLGRSSDADGKKFWTDALANGVSIDQVRNDFLNSDEYQSKHGSHYGGIERVPFNNYRAELHEGEEVVSVADKQRQSVALAQLNSVMREVKDELRAANTQRGAVAQQEGGKLDKVSEKLDGVSRQLARMGS